MSNEASNQDWWDLIDNIKGLSPAAKGFEGPLDYLEKKIFGKEVSAESLGADNALALAENLQNKGKLPKLNYDTMPLSTNIEDRRNEPKTPLGGSGPR